jgi:hypothetical protein
VLSTYGDAAGTGTMGSSDHAHALLAGNRVVDGAAQAVTRVLRDPN